MAPWQAGRGLPASAPAGRSGSTSGALCAGLPENGFGGCLAAQLVEASRRRQFTDRARPVFQNRAFLPCTVSRSRACGPGLPPRARRAAGQRPGRLLPGDHRSAPAAAGLHHARGRGPARRRSRLLPHGLGQLSAAPGDDADRPSGATAGRGGVARHLRSGSTAGTWRPSRSTTSARPRPSPARACTSCPSRPAGSPRLARARPRCPPP